jgi:flagellar basal-body rod protein FlgB
VIDQLSTVTSATVSVALDALSQRQQLIARNLANLGGEGSASEIDFESALARALESDGDATASNESLARLREDLAAGQLTRNGAYTASADVELVRLNDTVIRYQALIQALGKHGSLTRMAIAGEIK